MTEKTYTEAEIAEIMGAAARLQAAEGTLGQEGLTLEEIKLAAAEAGIDPRFVEIASSAAADHKKAYGGIPTGISRSLFVRGTLTEETWQQMVQQFVRTFGGPGETAVHETQRTWTRDAVRITVEQSGDQLLLHAETNWGKELELPVAFTLVGAIATLVTGALALVSLEWMIGVVAMLMAALVVGAFSVYRNRKAAQQGEMQGQFESTLNRCAVLLQGKTTPATPETSRLDDRVSDKLIDLPDATPAGKGEEEARSHHRNRLDA